MLFEQIIERWREEIANPVHFASIGPNPIWEGGYCKSWRDYRRKQIARKREDLEQPESVFKV